MRCISALVFFILLAVCLGCGGGGGGGGGSSPPWEGFSTGSATWNGVIGPDGCVPYDLLLQTGSDVSFLIAEGTCLRTVLGTRVFGLVTIGIDDSGGPAALMTTPDLKGVTRPYVLDGGALVDATFSPPAKILFEIAEWGTPGAWEVYTNQAAGQRVLGPDPSNLGGPGNAGTPIFLGCVSTDEFAREVVDVPRVGPLGYHFVPFGEPFTSPKPATVPGLAAMSTRDIPLPGATGATWPKVYAWKLYNPDTAEYVAIGTSDGGMTSGQSQTTTYGGNTYTAAIVPDGGGRKLQITTNVSNKLRYELSLCNEDGTGTETSGDASGGSSGETDTGGTYAGTIEISITGWGGAKELLGVEGDIEDALDPPESSTLGWFDKPSGGDRWFARVDVHGHSGSAATLAGDLPAGWMVTVGDRSITIVIPCPAATVAVGEPTTTSLTTLNPVTFVPIQAELLPGPVLDFAILPNGETAAAATAGMLHIVDLPTAGPSTMSVAVPGLTGAVALSPFDDLAYVATDTGRFEAYDLDTATLQWFIATLPMEPYSSLCVASDGAFAYATAPGSEQIVEIDLVHQELGRTIAVPGSDRADVSGSGLELCVVDTDGGGIRIVDLVDELFPPLIPTHVTPLEALWTHLDEHIVVCGDLHISVIDPVDQLSLGEFVIPETPLSITTGFGFDGDYHTVEVLATVPAGLNYVSPGVVRVSLEEAPPPLVYTPITGPADLIRANGR